jgi:BASS family bile acid:Na+ symporter
MRSVQRILWLLGNRNFLFIAAVVLGISAGQVARWTQPWTLPALAVAMTVSITQVTSDAFWPLRKLVRPMLLSILLNYVILGTAILAPARLLIAERGLWIGFVISAAVPPGVAVIPFSYIAGGDASFALVGTVGAYLAALAITPAMALWLLGESLIEPVRLISTLLQLIVIPLILSRLVLISPVRATVERWRGKIVNWAFFVVIFTIVGLNRSVFLREPQLVVLISAITVARSFGLAVVLERVLRRLQVEEPSLVSYMLMGTLKNGGMAAATALALFDERASVPAAVGAALAVPYLLWIGTHWGRRES